MHASIAKMSAQNRMCKKKTYFMKYFRLSIVTSVAKRSSVGFPSLAGLSSPNFSLIYPNHLVFYASIPSYQLSLFLFTLTAPATTRYNHPEKLLLRE